jgi:4'-phosphopantetheinyl transferase EntD
MMHVSRALFAGIAGETVFAELTMPEPMELARDASRLHEAERELAMGFAAATRREAFLAGRLALHAALADFGDSRAHRMPVLRDQRGRPQASWAEAPAFSIAHTRIRAVAAVSANRACRALGVDVEELDAHRAEALLRMAISAEERALIGEVDPQLLTGPLALWCARESCVKAHALEVGWFGSVLRVTRFARVPGARGDSGHLFDDAFEIDVSFESKPAMHAQAWVANGAVFALCAR